MKCKRNQINISEKYLIPEANYFLSFAFKDIYKLLNIKQNVYTNMLKQLLQMYAYF